jgi:hypothetical protein
VDAAHADGDVFTNALGLLVFRRQGDAGMFVMFPQLFLDDLPHVIRPLPESPPFVLKGAGKAILTDHPIEALALKALYPQNVVMAIGELSPPEAVLSRLKCLDAEVAGWPMKSGHRLARQFAPLKLPKKNIKGANSWADYWRMNGPNSMT